MISRRHTLTAAAALCLAAASPASRAASPAYATLYQFNDTDGNFPVAPVTLSNGKIYGTTTFGGPAGFGTVFSLAPVPGGAWVESVLHQFKASEGFSPFGSLVVGPGGQLFGTTYLGGPGKAGTVFALTEDAGGAWTLNTLHAFTGTRGVSSDGGNSSAEVTIGDGGVLYGTTTYGGEFGSGTVFSLTPPASPGGTWAETILHSFGGPGDGADPIAGLVPGAGGVLYGTTYSGGASGSGTVFSLVPPASPGGAWTETIVYSFTGGNDGGAPYYGSLVMDSAGVLYGNCETGGINLTGAIFSLTPPTTPGGRWTETVLHNYLTRSGKLPLGGLAIDSSGNLFGTTSAGGPLAAAAGTVFRLAPPSAPGGNWQYSDLHVFTYGSGEGAMPYAGVVLGPNRTLFGTTSGVDPLVPTSFGTVYAVRP